MSAPFEKFIVCVTKDDTSFVVMVSAPERLRADLEAGSTQHSEEESEHIRLERALFIGDALREKLEREKP